MPTIQIPYGDEFRFLELAEDRLGEVLMPPMHYYLPRARAAALIQNALERPAGTKPLSVLAQGKRRVVVLAEGADRAAPARLTLPPLLAQIRGGSPEAEICILVPSGSAGPVPREELARLFGQTLLESERVVCHDRDDDDLAEIGTLPSGGALRVHRLAAEADLLVTEGAVRPHAAAGFVGAGMRILPGIAGRESAGGAFGGADEAGFRADLRFAVQAARVAFSLDVVLNLDKDVVFASAGDAAESQAACERLLRTECAAEAEECPFVIAAAGGAPFDRTFWQSVETLAAAEPAMKAGGVSVLIARCGGGEGVAAPWQTALLDRLKRKTRILLVSDLPDDAALRLGVTPVSGMEEAVEQARRLTGGKERAAVIPDASALIVERP